MKDIVVKVASYTHLCHADKISQMIENAAKARGTGIALRKPDYITQKIREGKAVIALHNNTPVGFCYIETWEHNKYVANSGLVVAPEYRKLGLAKEIKRSVFNLSKTKFPNAKIFGITTSPAVMKINSELGYKPVSFSELTVDDQFWNGCKSCPNHDILERTKRKYCLCTGMLVNKTKEEISVEKNASSDKEEKLNFKDEEKSCFSL